MRCNLSYIELIKNKVSHKEAYKRLQFRELHNACSAVVNVVHCLQVQMNLLQT